MADPGKPTLETLKACRCLERVSPVMLRRFASVATPVELQENDILFESGRKAEAAFVVCDGWLVTETVDAEGRAVLIELAPPGALLSFAEAITHQTHTVTARAATAARVVRLPAERLRAAFQSDARFRGAALHATNLQILAAIEQVGSLKGATCQERVARFLLELSGRRAGALSIDLPLEKRLIARWAGMTEWTISRVLADLRPHGLEMRGRKVHIADIRAFSHSLGLATPRSRRRPAVVDPDRDSARRA